MTTTQQIINELTTLVDTEKEYTRNELGKMLTRVYHHITWDKSKKTTLSSNKPKKTTLCYSDFGSEYDIESLSEPVKKTLSKFDSDNVKEYWCKYGNWVLINKNSFRGGSALFYKGDVHERH